MIPPLNAQARLNLTGNARDLWVAGIRDIRGQSSDLKDILGRPGVREDAALVSAIEAAITSTGDLALWLEAEAQTKTAPPALGRTTIPGTSRTYTWYL